MKEGVWLAKLDAELRQQESVIEIYEDNQSTITIASTHISFHNDRSKHIDVRYHYIRDITSIHMIWFLLLIALMNIKCNNLILITNSLM